MQIDKQCPLRTYYANRVRIHFKTIFIKSFPFRAFIRAVIYLGPFVILLNLLQCSQPKR